MSLKSQILFWLGALAVTCIILIFLRGMLLPFVAGMILAYLLDPVADRLESWGLGRVLASSLILGAALVLFSLALLLLIPVLSKQLVSFAENLPGYLKNIEQLAQTYGGKWLSPLINGDLKALSGNLSAIATKGVSWLAALLKSIWSGGMALVNVISLMVITPIVAFYMLIDWDHMIEKVDSWLPRDHAPAIREIASGINLSIAGFLRGQGTVCLLLGLFYAIGLTIAGLNFGLLIGLGAGLISFIPYVGSVLGLVISLGVALVQFWPDWVMILVILAIFSAGQFLEGNILSPKLVGSSIGLHPVWLMFALFAFGYLFGFTGLLLAVPLAAAFGVVLRFLLKQYLTSPVYLGASGPAREPDFALKHEPDFALKHEPDSGPKHEPDSGPS